MTVSLCCEAVTKLKSHPLCSLDEAESNSLFFPYKPALSPSCVISSSCDVKNKASASTQFRAQS